MTTAISFRRLDVEADLALVHGWMQEPHVVPWWELAGPPERVRDYLCAQAARDHLDCWIASDDGRPFAYVETYVASDDPLGAHYPVQPGDRGFHLLVGPPELLGTGVARRLVRHLVTFLLDQFGITRVVCEPDVRNRRMVAFCRALGGEQLATFDFDGRRVALFGWTEQPEVAAA
ncbi:MAG: GNAT family N-acetyltransferase [Solirubrobacteraceae bacterium]|nr:GNAT family N-acetyltransferase [Solirubrobacteraceae bacterium]